MDILKQSIKIIFFSLLILSLGGVVYAWTEPTSTPPSGNISAPVNVGSDLQYKEGDFWAKSLNSDSYSYIYNTNSDPMLYLHTTGNYPSGSGYESYKISSWIDMKNTSNSSGWLLGNDEWSGGIFSILRSESPWTRLFTIKSDGNVGIGTTNPGNKLTINLTDKTGSAGRDAIGIEASSDNSFGAISVNKPAIKFWSTSDNNWADAEFNNLTANDGITLGGVKKTAWPSGTSGSGTDNYIPRWNGTSALENSIIKDDGTTVKTGDGSAAVAFQMVGKNLNNWNSNNVIFGDNTNNSRYFMGTRGTLDSSVAPWKMYYYKTSPDEWKTTIGIYPTALNANTYAMGLHDDALYINSTGNVGIGTTEPATKLEVADMTSDVIISATTKGNVSGYSTKNNAYTKYKNKDMSQGWLSGLINWDKEGNYSIMQSESPWARFFTIDSSGNVGIGMTPSTGARLEVSGNVQASGLDVSGPAYVNYGSESHGAVDGLAVNGNILGDRLIGYGNGGVGTNSAVGGFALNTNTTGSNNVTNGYSALYYNTTGSYNVANGTYALYKNNTGNYNTANGYKALYSNTTGYDNTANGYKSLYSNTTGYDNTANGYKSLYSNTTGYSNTANGTGALYSNTTGSSNTANSMYALYYNTTGSSNTANGLDALYYNTTGSSNTANGADALYYNTTGYYNTANGTSALSSNTTGYDNTANGYKSLYSNTTGYKNTTNGYKSLYSNTTGYANTAIGFEADVSSGALSNATAIGYSAKVGSSNKVVIGNSSVSSIGGYAGWTDYSDARLKENIYYKNDLGLNFITDLKTASFNYKEDANKVRRDGLIAQDVQITLEKLGVKWSGLVIDDDEQKTLNISYGSLTIPLINSVKELKAENDKLKSDNDDLRLRIENLEAKIK